MAKVTITVEDNPDGKTVKVTPDPKFAELARISKDGSLTYAQGFAVSALLHLRTCGDIQSEKRSKSRLFIP